MWDFLRRLFNPDKAYIDKLLAEQEASVVSRLNLVRNGIAYTFVEHQDGTTWVFAARRTKPYTQATFQVKNRADAIAWYEDGVVPPGQIFELLKQFEAGTWPTPLRNN